MAKNDKRREFWKEREFQGLCIYCGNSPPKQTAKGCAACLEKKYKQQKAYIDRHPNIQKDYRQKIKNEVITKYGGQCCCCGISNIGFLTIDHKNMDGYEERMALYGNKAGATYRWYLKLRKEPLRKDLRVLCYNCNIASSIYGRCPHEFEKENAK